MTKKNSLASIAFVLIFGAIAPMLDTTMTNIAINTIMDDLNTSVGTAQWVTTGYVLTLGIVILFTGWAVDKFDGKKLYINGLLIFLVGSIISGIANNITILMIGRMIQGAGSGIIIPLLTTLIIRAANGVGLGKLAATLGLPMVVIPILGPTVGGYIIDQLNWHWVFYINIPIVIIALIFVLTFMPHFEPLKRDSKLDWIGFLILSGMFSGFLVGIVNFSSHNTFSSIEALLPTFLGFDLLIAYVFYAQKFPQRALVNLNMFKVPNFSGSAVILLMSGVAVNGAMFLLPLYLQNIRGLSVIWSGTYLIAQGLGLLVTRTQIGKLTDNIGARWVVLSSIIIAIISTIPFVYFDVNTNKYLILIALFVRGMAQGGLTIPVMADSYTNIPKEQIAQATTATRMLQNVGGAFGSAILATVIQNQVNGLVPTVSNLTSAYHTAFIWSIVITLLAAIPAWFLTHHIAKDNSSEQPELEGDK
ncbi:MDR family MFS transporter [Liquorilactobacillus oeni]|uniref:Major facilitator superfamily permease n=1 Tax=Liquorilactobacillus oeni DSM 19972 TaxID=1423777 RepID=A0A0R1MAH0_9LACO|nr:MDR family MFS transporter [Liquorilactobacillus oeni]KRL05135.1 major facilitator superfamily permease [Liquorilactobacillus oeni DSM 19972]